MKTQEKQKEIPIEKLVTVDYAAERLEVCRATIYSMFRSGELLKINVGKKNTRVLAEQVQEYIDKQKRIKK